MAEVMIGEIGRRPGEGTQETANPARGVRGSRIESNAVGFNREGYALAAGLALGLITLGQGQSMPLIQDLNLPDRLRWGVACWSLGHGVYAYSTIKQACVKSCPSHM